MAVRARLEAAIGTGEVIGIVYHGGSQPGAFRDISPLGIEGDVVRARCYTSGAVKTFGIEKIELRGVEPSPEDKANTRYVGHGRKPRFQALSQVHEAQREALAGLGWHVAYEIEPDAERLSLHSTLKNGKLRKTPDASLAYQAMATIARATESGEVVLEAAGPRTRPWIVSAKSISPARTFANGDEAMEIFMRAARELAPSSGR